MGCRKQPRIEMTLLASLCGVDAQGRAFVDRVRVLNMSRDGALLEDGRCPIQPGDTVALRCDTTTRRFRVVWDQKIAGQGRLIGLAAASPVPATAECLFPASQPDEYVRPRMSARRRNTRYDCEVAVELRTGGGEIPMWVTATDISAGGCRVQVAHAVAPGSEVSLALWLDFEKVWMQGTVTHSLYGCGTGIRFGQVQNSAQQRLAKLLESSETEVIDRRGSEEQSPLCAAYCSTS
jgi:hypothetical protein